MNSRTNSTAKLRVSDFALAGLLGGLFGWLFAPVRELIAPDWLRSLISFAVILVFLTLLSRGIQRRRASRA